MNVPVTLLTIFTSGHLESPKVVTLKSSPGSASGTNDSLTGNDATGLYSLGGHISGIPEDMLAGIDWRQNPHESQRSLYAVLKPNMAKLCPSVSCFLHLGNLV